MTPAEEARTRLRQQFHQALLTPGAYVPGPRVMKIRLDALMAAPALAELLTAAHSGREQQRARLVAFLQGRRRDSLRALLACTDTGADYWRWQGHAELSRQALELLGEEVPSVTSVSTPPRTTDSEGA